MLIQKTIQCAAKANLEKEKVILINSPLASTSYSDKKRKLSVILSENKCFVQNQFFKGEEESGLFSLDFFYMYLFSKKYLFLGSVEFEGNYYLSEIKVKLNVIPKYLKNHQKLLSRHCTKVSFPFIKIFLEMWTSVLSLSCCNAVWKPGVLFGSGSICCIKH